MTGLPAWVNAHDTPRPDHQVTAEERMHPLELTTIREALGLTREALADALGVSVDSVASWELGRRTIPDGVRRDIEALEAYTAQVVEHIVEQLRQSTGEPTIGVYARDAGLPAPPPDAPLTPTARWWRAVAYEVARQVPGVRITDANQRP